MQPDSSITTTPLCRCGHGLSEHDDGVCTAKRPSVPPLVCPCMEYVPRVLVAQPADEEQVRVVASKPHKFVAVPVIPTNKEESNGTKD